MSTFYNNRDINTVVVNFKAPLELSVSRKMVLLSFAGEGRNRVASFDKRAIVRFARRADLTRTMPVRRRYRDYLRGMLIYENN